MTDLLEPAPDPAAPLTEPIDDPREPAHTALASRDPLATVKALAGIHPDEESTLDLHRKSKVVEDVFRGLMVPLDLESACYAADISPQTFGLWIRESPALAKAIRRKMATLEKSLIREMRKGGKGFPRAKAALTVLERNYKRWEAKTTISIARSFEGALDELEAKLDAETFALVMETLERHS